MKELIEKYKKNISILLNDKNLIKNISHLSKKLLVAWKNKNCIYLCGNGGSAGNANHIANDLIYGAGKQNGYGLNVEALSSNPSVITCLANDTGYENIFSEQLKAKGKKNDLLIVLSGSGNSKNVVNAIKVAKKIKMKTFAIVGYNGGICKKIADNNIHFKINDMQLSEDFQLIAMHMCMKWLSKISIKKNKS